MAASASTAATTPVSMFAGSVYENLRVASMQVGKASGPVDLGIVSPDNCELLDGVQRIVDEAWRKHGADIAGDRGYKAIRIQAARDSHPEFPIFASILGSCPSLGNGHLPAHASALCRCPSSALLSTS